MMNKLITGIASAAILSACVTVSAETKAEKPDSMSKPGAMITTQESQNNFEDTLAKLKSAINDRGLKTFAIVDHAKGAASIGADLNPTTLVIFGNPKGGTPLIQAEQALGIALPLKALVYETQDGRVLVSTTDIKSVLDAYGASGVDAQGEKIAGLLSALSAAATSAE